MTKLLDGKALSQQLAQQLQNDIAQLKQQDIIPALAVITMADDPAGQLYLRSKQRLAKQLGITLQHVLFTHDMTNNDALCQIKKLNNDHTIHGIMIQLPLDKNFNTTALINALDPQKDVDGCHPLNLGKIWTQQPHWIPATPLGIMQLLQHYQIPISGKNVVIVGRSNIVGRPLAGLFLNNDSTVSIVHHQTHNLSQITQQADILCVAAGMPRLITAAMVKEHAVVIDVGTNYDNNHHLVGDVDFKPVSAKADYITPVPGGVGPMTVISLMQQVVMAAKEENDGK